MLLREGPGGWSLDMIQGLTPAQKLDSLLAARNWEAALKLAESRGLDPDAVHLYSLRFFQQLSLS